MPTSYVGSGWHTPGGRREREKRRRAKAKRFGKSEFSPQPMTQQQREEVARQRAEREARGARPGTGGSGLDYQPPRGRQTVEMRQFTPEEMAAMPEKTEEVFEKTPFGILEESPENQAFRERMKQPLTAGMVVEATAWGLGIAAGGVGLAGLGVSGAAASGGMAAVTRAAGAKMTKETGKVILGKAALNTKNAGKTISLFSKLTKNYRALAILGGYAFSTHLSLNDRSDTIMSLGIALNNANRAGDLERAKELLEIMEEVNRVGTIIEAFAPLVNYPLAAIRKARLTFEAGSSMVRQMEDTEYTPTPYEIAKRKEADEYWAGVLDR